MISIAGDAQSLEYVDKHLRSVFSPLNDLAKQTQRDSTDITRKMAEAIKIMELETGKKEFTLDEINERAITV
jgi:hypothetical protein